MKLLRVIITICKMFWLGQSHICIKEILKNNHILVKIKAQTLATLSSWTKHTTVVSLLNSLNALILAWVFTLLELMWAQLVLSMWSSTFHWKIVHFILGFWIWFGFKRHYCSSDVWGFSKAITLIFFLKPC